MKSRILLLLRCIVIFLGCIVIYKVNFNQTVNTDPITKEKINLENVNEDIKTVGQLVLTDETGTATIEYNSSAGKWHSWLTNVETKVSLDYRILIGVDLNNITFVDNENEIIVVPPNEFEILAIETDNKKIESDYSFLSKIESDELKIELEEKIVNDIRKNSITDETKLECIKSFENNLRKIANNFNVDIVFY